MLAACLGGASPWAQAQSAEATLGTVTVKPADPGSFPGITLSDDPAERTPASTQIITAAELTHAGARRLSDALSFDASASDAYNAIGYWDHVTLRGFVIDQNQNHRRDGLPISAETSIPLENKASIDIWKGTSGIQTGTSSPGGLVNYTVKRPTAANVRTVRVETGGHGGGLAHVDLGGRFGKDRAVGYRLNIATETIRNHVPSADGQRTLAALALDWRLARDSLLEVEAEQSQRRQPSVPGLSLQGTQLPAPNPFTNINSQPWSQAGVMKGTTGSMRFEQALNADWRWGIQASSQHLKTDDFLAYPYGCYEATSGRYFADRYCPNGDFDLYDFRSLAETRHTQAIQLHVKGQTRWGNVAHQLTVGTLRQRQTDDGQAQADNNPAVGTGNLHALPSLPADPTFTDPYTQRSDRSTEWFAHDRMAWTDRFSTWVGLRHSQLNRSSVRTDGTRATAYRQGFTSPWLALAWEWNAATLAYASVGQGVESFVAPGRSRYTNAGQALPPLKSRQWEMGLKHHTHTTAHGITLFQITRPRAGDAGTCDVASSCTFQMDGDDQHKGLELSTQQAIGAWSLRVSTMFLQAHRRHSTINPQLNRHKPTNVPQRVLRVTANHAFPSLPGLSLQTRLSHEGPRSVVPDGSIALPAWTTIDSTLSYHTTLAKAPVAWYLGVDNMANKRYFKESPYQYSHVYLFPGSPRTWRIGLEAGF